MFIDFWIKFDHFLNKIWDLLLHMPQEASRWPQDRPRWLSRGNLGPTWAQVGSKLPRDGVKSASGCLKLGPSWIQVDSGWAQNQLQEAPGGSPEGSWEGPGMVLEPRGAPGGPRGAKMAPRAFKMTQNWFQKSFKFDPKSIKNMTSKSFQKQLPSLATLS